MAGFVCAALELTHRLDEHSYISDNLCQRNNIDKKLRAKLEALQQ